LDSGTGEASAHTPDTLIYENTIVVIQWHHISDGSQRHQIQIVRKVRLWPGFIEPAALSQPASQSHHNVENYRNTGRRFTGKGAACLIGVHNGVGRRQPGSRKMVIGDKYFYSQTMC